MKHEILSLLLKLWLICVICFITFCVSRYFNHFPKHDEKQAEAILPADFSKIATFLAVGPALFGYNIDKAVVEVYEAVKTAGNSYEILRRVK